MELLVRAEATESHGAPLAVSASTSTEARRLAITGDPMADRPEAGQLFRVAMDYVAQEDWDRGCSTCPAPGRSTRQ